MEIQRSRNTDLVSQKLLLSSLSQSKNNSTPAGKTFFLSEKLSFSLWVLVRIMDEVSG